MAKYSGEHIICCVTGRPGADLHHILSQKAHPAFRDESWNLLPVAHHIHLMIHQKGLYWVTQEIPSVRHYIESMGWEFDENRRRWFHPKQRGLEQ